MRCLHLLKRPDTGYISNNLILPKGKIRPETFKTSLTFTYGETEIIDEITNELIGIRPDRIRLWDETANHLIVPREFIPRSDFSKFKFEFADITPLEYPLIRVEDRIQLRSEAQELAFNALITNSSGTLNLACGMGKTVLALKLVARLGVPTIVVVNTSALMEQWVEEIQKHLGVKKVGVIQGSEASWGTPVVVAMVHTLSQRREEWPMEFRRRFGLVIYDEGHHMSAPVFVKSADLFFGRRFSLTATATRLDGLETIYQHHLGQVIYQDLSQDLIPTTIFHKLKWDFNDKRDREFIVDVYGEVNLSKVRGYLGSLDWRNEIIYRQALSDLENGRKILILTHSRDHTDLLKQKMERIPGVQVGTITGLTKQGTRMDTLRDCNPVIGTFQLARESLNKPELDTLYVTTPFSSPNDLQQAWGRIQRECEGKKSVLVRVFDDQAIDKCRRLGQSLRSTLNKKKYPVVQKVMEVKT